MGFYDDIKKPSLVDKRLFRAIKVKFDSNDNKSLITNITNLTNMSGISETQNKFTYIKPLGTKTPVISERSEISSHKKILDNIPNDVANIINRDDNIQMIGGNIKDKINNIKDITWEFIKNYYPILIMIVLTIIFLIVRYIEVNKRKKNIIEQQEKELKELEEEIENSENELSLY